MICEDCPGVTVFPNGDATYRVWAVDDQGCRASDVVRVRMESTCIDGKYDPANAFTPNGDGANDKFVINYTGPVTVERVRIYNRWGEMLYETEDPHANWDGVFRGKLVDPGVYVFYLEGTCEESGKFLRVGNVTMIR